MRRRWPIAVASALVGWVLVGNADQADLLGVGGIIALIIVVAVARESAIQERRGPRWTPWTIAAGVVVVLALTGASASYGYLHPLSAGTAEQSHVKDERAIVDVYLHNDGRAGVKLRALSVPGVRDLRVEYQAGRTVTPDGSFPLRLSVPCSAGTLDRLHTEIRVRGVELDQVVRLAPPVSVSCR